MGKQRKQLKIVRRIHRRRLHLLVQQAAIFGYSVPPAILMEIEDIKAHIHDLDAYLSVKHSRSHKERAKKNK